ncbi:MAG TPA: hypothetical protein VFT58_04895 [Nitrososphaera sp.]|nr:hypothetical protein [Nitrososphaera sp.]
MRRRATQAGLPTIAVDFLFLILLAFLLLINPPTKEAEDTTAPGNMSVTAAWQEGPIDVDLWLTGPGQPKATGYSNRGGSLFNLLRDDLGTYSDPLPFNFENAFSRGLPAGEYVINLHCFACPANVEVSVEVSMGERGQRQKLLFKDVVELRPKQERTVVRFRLDGNSNVVSGSVNQVYTPLRSAK